MNCMLKIAQPSVVLPLFALSFFMVACFLVEVSEYLCLGLAGVCVSVRALANSV